MDFQARNIQDYYRASEILYCLNASKELSDGIVSKIALQKILYLSTVLTPIKNVLMSVLRFSSNYRGPFSPEIQNTIDHLVALNYAEVVNFEPSNQRISRANYTISYTGIEAVKRLTRNKTEEEKKWWISTVTKLSIIYSKEEFTSDWKGLNKIVDLVYQEPTFSLTKKEKPFRSLIILNDANNLTDQLISFSKQFLERQKIIINKENERHYAEIILISFFEYLYVKLLNSRQNE